MTNQGEVTTAQAVDALRIIGNGGAITYSGDGGVTNSSGRDAGLFVTNVGRRHLHRHRRRRVSGTIGMVASTTGGGAVTIATGSGLVSGSAGPGVSAATADGALNVRIGSGGVTGVEHPGVELTTNNGDISVIANGDVSGFGLPTTKEPISTASRPLRMVSATSWSAARARRSDNTAAASSPSRARPASAASW